MSVFGAVANVTLLAALVITFGTPVDAAQPEAGRIVSITPSKARTGDRVTINGTGFGATNVRVTVGGKRAQLVSATGDQATFQIPDGVVPGATVVAATNPGGHTGTIGLTVLEGSLLGGSPTARALDALSNMPPVRVGRNVVDNGIIMSRIDVRLTADATVADLNAALLAVDGGIVSMAPGIPALTIAVPRQPTVDALLALIRALSGRPGIALAKLAREAGLMTFLEDRDFPLTEFNVELAAHLLPPRFVAAWNAASRVVDGQGHCLQPAIPILIPDEFGATPSDFTNDIPASSFRFVSGAADPALLDVSGDPEDHGYLVTRIIGAAGGSTGANPFVSCLDFRAIQTGGLSETQGSMEIANNLPAGKFILSYSQGYNDDCIDLAVPRDQCITPRDPTIAVPFDRADDALLWKQLTRGRWSDFLVATSAGNSRDTDAPNIYLGTGDSHFTNKMAISQLPDPLFAFVEDGSLWSPSSPGQVAAGFEPLFNAGDAAGMALLVQQSGEDAAVADNVLVVGSTTTLSGATILSSGASPTALAESTFSETGPDVRAVGEDIFHCGSRSCSGTSSAAPQVAGLASYMWLLSPDLRSRPASVTRQAIVANTSPALGVIDAYAAMLSLDGPALPTPATAPIRLAILDVNGDGKFDQDDIALFLNHFFFDANGNAVVEPTRPDYSRFDLNGDGFTGGSRKARFDLDRVGSTQFGATNYSKITQAVEGNLLDFDENALTDLDILCYYAYSDLYKGDPDVRRQLLSQLPGSQRCVFSVKPRTIMLNPGQVQQFQAIGAPGNGAVKWSASGCSIDQNTGAFTACGPGTVTVRATSVADPTAFAEATVTVIASSIRVGLGSRTCQSLVQGINGFFRTPIDGKTCDQYLNVFGDPAHPLPPPYAVPAMNVSGPVAGVFTYDAEYTESLSSTEVESNAVTGGQLRMKVEADAGVVQQGEVPNPPIVFSAASTSLSFLVLDDGPYLLTITGQISANFAFLNTVSLSVAFNSPNDPAIIVSLNQSGGQPISITKVLGRGINPATGQFFPSSVGIGLSAQAQISANAVAARTSGSEIAITFSFQRMP